MPLLLSKKIDEFSAYAVWNIQEELTELPKIACDKIPPNLNPIKEAEWIVSRVLAREVCNIFEIPFKGVGKEPTGKPFLIGSDVNISISHSFPIAGVMIHLNQSCGIDLELPREKLTTVQNKYLHPSEFESKDNLEELCKIWSSKEVIYKIFNKRNLSFKKDVQILLEENKGIGNILRKDEETSFEIHYEWVKNYLIAYGSESK